jgi:phage major head subunit gpT-like protein
MSVITTGAHPKDLWPGIVKHFGNTYDEHQEEYSQIFEVVMSDKAYEERAQYVGLGLAGVKTQGAGVYYDANKQGIVPRLTNVTYGIGAIVTREAIEDGQYESIATRLSKAMAFSCRQTDENVAANVLNRGFTAAYTMTNGDGKELFATDHPLQGAGGGTYSNELSVGADLSESSLEDLVIQIMQATDERGLKISLMPKKLVIHPNEYFNAHRILESVQQSGTANNDTNVLKSKGIIPEGVVTNHYLTDASPFFVTTNIPSGTGLVYQLRRDKEFTQDNDFDTENAKMKATKRFAVGWVDPRGCYASAGD